MSPEGSFSISATTEDIVVAVNKTKGKESPTTTNSGAISRNVLIHLQKVEKEMEVVDIWCELKDKTKLHSVARTTIPT